MDLVIWIVLFAAFVLWVVASDVRIRRIRNKGLLVALLVQGCWLLAITAGVVPHHELMPSWYQAGLGFGLGLLLFYPLWMFGAMGAADVKLIATLGFIVGFSGLWPTLLMASLAAGLHVFLIVRQGRWQVVQGQWRQGSQQKRGLPYGAYLAGAALLWVIASILNVYG